MNQEGAHLECPTMASALTPPDHELAGPSQGLPQNSAGVHWAPAEIRLLLAIMEEPTIKRRLKMVHRNTSVYEDVARRLQEHGYARLPHQCRTKFKALKVAYKKAHMAILSSGAAPQSCPFYEEMSRVLQAQGSNSPDHLRKQIKPGDPDPHNWLTQRRERDDGHKGGSQPPPPQEGPEMETEHPCKLGVEVCESPPVLSPESPAGAQADQTSETEVSYAAQGIKPGAGKSRMKRAAKLPLLPPTEVQKRPKSPGRNQIRNETLSPPTGVVSVSTVPPRARASPVHQLQARARSLRRHQPAVDTIASEMAENRHLASKLARESAAQLQRHLDQHDAHMAALVQVARDSYAQRQEVVAILQDVADDIHEGVALLRSSVSGLSQE